MYIIPEMHEVIRARDVNFKPEELSASTISTKIKSIAIKPKDNFSIDENAIRNDLVQDDYVRAESDECRKF